LTIRRRVSLSVLAAMAALAATGALYQTISIRSESTRFPPPGRLVSISDPSSPTPRRLHLICLGQGEPTVIFESSGLGSALSSSLAREEISAHTRVCSYDRAGMGWSDPGPSVISAGLLADDLERLIARSELTPPFILVPASLGGLTAELFARRHRDQVAGLIFVDAGNSEILKRAVEKINWMEIEGVCLLKTAARFGVLRLLDPLRLQNQSPHNAAQAISRVYRVEPMSTLCGVARGIRMTAEELAAAPPLSRDIPLTVLVHESPEALFPPALSRYNQLIEPEWLPLQQRFAQHSSRGTWRVVPGSDHLIGNSQPHAVASAVLQMLTELRNGG
jgi:pimeloyl-ACP methyl ester carboxylesterase